MGRDESFFAASREGARPAPRDPKREPDSSTSTPNWLTRTGQRSSHERGAAGTYEAETGRRDPGYFSDPELETGRRSRQAPARGGAGPEAGDSHYNGAARDAGHDPRADGDVDTERLAAQNGPSEPLTHA